MKMFTLAGLAVLTISLLPAPALAQAKDSVTLPNVVVTATKAPTDKARVAVPVTVITGADLRAKGITRVVDALREAPGVSIVQNGSSGSVASVFLRGGESRYTKVLLDGVPLNAPGGYIDLSHLTTDNVERIEIVRGPSSVVHGADAVVGVIQIFTRAGGGVARSSIVARAGSMGTREVELSATGQARTASYSLGGGFHATDGIHSFNNEYRNGTVSGSLAVPVERVANFRFVSRYTTAEYHYPTDYTGQPVDSNSYRVQHRLIASVQADRDFTDHLHATVTAGANDLYDLTEDVVTPFGSTVRVNTADRSVVFRRFIAGHLTFQLPHDASLTFGSAYQREREAAANLERPLGGSRRETATFSAARTNAALYAELLGEAARKIAYTVSARLDRNSDFGSFSTHSAGGSYLVLPATRLRASFGTAFNAPSFSQLRPTLYTVGSPGLSPERSTTWQAGVEHRIARGVTVTGTHFRARFNQMIQYVSGGPPSYKGSYANLAAATANGSELEAEIDPSFWTAALMGLKVKANYSEVRPKVARLDKAYSGSLNVGDALIRRATHTGNASISFVQAQWDVSGIAGYVGKRPDVDFSMFPSPTLTLPAYTRLDLAGNFTLSALHRGNWRATWRIENAADRHYRDVIGFDAPGRAVYVGLRWGSRP